MIQRITTFLTFPDHGMEAVKFYTSIFKNSSVESSMVMPGTDQLLHAAFTLDGHHYMAMDGGEHFKFADGFSLFVSCEDQAEVDYYWDALTADGGEPGQCGWLKDKFGVSWQVVPKQLGELMQDLDPAKSQKVMEAMLNMTKIDVEQLQDAHDS
jgi:predicted 3-demethylubiquinone-9 3-methyltransferase (glyoxalase superfamily)